MADLTVDYKYRVLDITHVSDGDTVDMVVKLEAHVDFGFSIKKYIDHGTHETRVRIFDIDTWEKRGETLEIAKAAQEYTKRWLGNALVDEKLFVYTLPDKHMRDKMGNFRRYLATFVDESMGDEYRVDTGNTDINWPDGIRYKLLADGLRQNGFEKTST